MSQRMIAAVVAGPLVIVLLALAAFAPLPYVTYRPGDTINVLGDESGQEIIQVEGHRTYRDAGELRMTTVIVSQPEQENSLLELMATWINGDNAVMPYDAVYREGVTEEENDVEGSAQMVSSQDAAIAVALTELGYELTPRLQVQAITPGSPAADRLEVRDIFLEANGQKVTSSDDVIKAVSEAAPGEKVTFLVRRGEVNRRISLTPEKIDGEQRIGVTLGQGYIFPFDVSVNINPLISGPSAGLMFSLAIYDTLTPGSLTDNEVVAGTGEIAPDGSVGPIGGIAQKIAGARDDGAELFLVPPANCADIDDVDNGDMELVLAETMHDAVEALEAWADGRDADVPRCDDLARREAQP
ncbi:MAG: PDZ domain-containing protein [Actinomycetota bacterium]|nr:PDZ domain-containing protein [Actinomycetota bacterium]